MDKKAISKSLLASAISSAALIAIFICYSNTSPQNVITFEYLPFIFLIISIFLIPLILIIGYAKSLLLFKLNLFNIFLIALVPTTITIITLTTLRPLYSPSIIQILQYCFIGLIPSLITIITYKNITQKITKPLTNYISTININWKIIRNISILLILISIIPIIIDIIIISNTGLTYKESDFIGCFAHDLVLSINFNCQGFIGEHLITAWLNWPLILLMATIFFLFSVDAFLITILGWTPFIMYFVSTSKIRKNIENS